MPKHNYELMTEKYDTADYLDSPSMISAYLQEILDSADPALISHGIDAVKRARCKAPYGGI